MEKSSHLQQWSKITGFPEEVVYHVEKVFADPEDGEVDEKSEYFAIKLAELTELLGLHCDLSVKYDGTNLGKDAQGTLYGRRQIIPDTLGSYQKVPIAGLREVDVAAILQDVLKELRSAQKEGEAFPEPEHFMVFGELMCNRLFDYQEIGVVHSWQPFGIQFVCPSVEGAMSMKEALRNAGYPVPTGKFSDDDVDGEKVKLRVGLCPKMVELFKRHNLPHPPIVASGSLTEVVAKMEKWMCSAKGEGVMVAMGGQLRKWKIAEHASPTQRDRLKKALEMLESKRDLVAKHAPTVPALIQSLYNVSTSEIKAGKPKAAKKSTKQQPYDPAEVEKAIESAVTKFDAPEAFFEKALKTGGKPNFGCTVEYKNTVMEEVMNSGDLVCPPEKAAQGKKQVDKALKKFVGTKFGQWMKSRSE